jgi:hypothetical protein
MKTMSEIMRRYGTDKDTHHRYADVYERLFPDRSIVKNVLEVGLAEGGSILAWREIFVNANIVGVDKEYCPVERGPRLEIHQANQRDRDALRRIAGNRQFDMIVEDASHILDNNLLTLFFLWPYVKEGGYYVIEEMQDVHCYKDCCQLFKGCELVPTPCPYGGEEILVVIRK